VVPTWIAVKEHTPVEVEKNYGSEEEHVEQESEVLDADAKNKLVVVKSNTR
jgi:hypothetical protein